MTESAESPSRTNFVRILPGVIISLVALGIIFFLVDWRQVMDALRGAQYLYLFLGLPIYLAGYGFRAMAWRTLLMDEVPFKQVFLTMQVGYFLNNVLPFRLGELGRALLLGRKGLGFWRVFSTILIERAFDMILAAGLLLGTIPFVLGGSQSRRAAYFVVFIVLFGMLILHLLAKYQDWALAKFEGLSGRWSFLSHFGEERLKAFFEGLSALVHFPRFLRVLGWMAFSWGAAILYQYVLLLAFDPGAKLLWVGFGVATASLGVALPSTPSYIGVLEAAWIGALAFFNVPFATALAYAIVAHTLHILISVFFGMFGLSQEGETIGQLYNKIQKRPSSG